MMIFKDGRDRDMVAEEPRPLRLDRLARMIAADNWLHQASPCRRARSTARVRLYTKALLGLISIAVIVISLGLLDVGLGL